MGRLGATDREALRRVLRDQDAVISRAEAFRCGMTPSQLRYWIRPGGPWQRLLPGVYFTPTQIRTEPDRVAAEIRSALRAGQQRPALAVRALPAA